MNTEDRVMAVLGRANPMPEDDPLELDTDAVTYLATLEQRSSEVTQLDTRPKEQDKFSRWTLIGVAAAAVLILGTALVLMTRDSEEPPVATDPPPSTIVTPTTTPEATEDLSPELQEALAVATAFTEARRDKDIQGMYANGIEGHVNGFIVGSLETMPEEFAWQDAVGWTTEVQDCRITVPDEVRPTIACEVTHQTAISEALGVGPYPGTYYMKIMYAGDEKLGVPITETTVTEALSFEFANPQFTAETWRPFIEWVENTYPDDLDRMLAGEVDPNLALFLVGGERLPSLSEQSIALWSQYVAEFVAEQS